VRKFSDIINELADVAPLSKGADYLAVSLRIVRWVRENWLAGKLDIFGRLNGGGVLKVVRPDPFLDFFREVERTELVWRIRYLPEGSRLPREGFWGDLAIGADAAAQLRDAIAGRSLPADAAGRLVTEVKKGLGVKRRPGPPPTVFNELMDKMRKYVEENGADALKDAKQIELKSLFGHSERWCAVAKKSVLAEIEAMRR
jgi:hypothetical protein